MPNALENLKEYQRQTRILGDIASVLYWDQATCMPKDAVAYRGKQLATISGLTHERIVHQRYADLLCAIENLIISRLPKG